jgi:hypothetical protein
VRPRQRREKTLSRAECFVVQFDSRIRRIAFLHNAKTAGTSIIACLRNAFPASQSGLFFDNSPHERAPEKWNGFAGCSFIAGHFGWEVIDALGGGFDVLTSFRHPVPRIISLYDYWRVTVSDETVAAFTFENGPSYAKRMTFSEFVRARSPFLSLYIEDCQVRQLLRSPWLSRPVTWLDLTRSRLRISDMRWFYVCEQPEMSTAWFRREFPSIDATGLNERRNASDPQRRTTPSADDIAVILQRNRADLAIYRHALAVLNRRMVAPARHQTRSNSFASMGWKQT